MKIKAFSIIAFLAILAPLLGGPAAAQEPQPPAPPYPLQDLGKPFGPLRTPEGYWFMPESSRLLMEAADVLPQVTGGPDDFGYTWDDSVEFHWIDASSGTDTGLSGDSWGKAVGPIRLPFQFKYYENTYNEVWIAASGYLAFTQASYWSSESPIPSPVPPNNVIAPYWAPIYIGPGSWVRYSSGGNAPNRYFVVEWHDVKGGNPSDPIGRDETYRFEVILYENGDIVFQYHTMSYNDGVWCAAAGIEDSTGMDGLAYVKFCYRAPSNKAVRFYRPAPSARVKVWPLYQGRFTRAGAIESFQVPIRNAGDLGADTYDLFVSSSWPISLYAADGTTPLIDTDGDGVIDTGPVAESSTVTITVKVQTPAVVNVGDHNFAIITVSSSLNPSKSKTVILQTAVPAPFAQAYWDAADGAMSLYLVQPNAQAVKKATSDGYYGSDIAVAEAPNGNFVYAWDKSRRLDSNIYVGEIAYALLDRYGNVVRPVSKLTDHSGAMMDTYDISPAIAVAPNGRIGVLWLRVLRDPNISQYNYNIWFAILDSSGNRVYGPVNLTNNTAWGTPWFRSPRIAATGDNRFVLAWQRSSSDYVDDIFYAIRDTSGGEVKPVTQFTHDTPGWDQAYYNPTVAGLSGNRVLLAWSQAVSNIRSIAYAVLDSSGGEVRSPATINMSDWGLQIDAVQLSTGRILLAWTSLQPQVVFAVLDTDYNVVAGPTTLSNPVSLFGDAWVSVAADAAGHAILTWMESMKYMGSPRYLYYALVDSNGNFLTPPMIFRTAEGYQGIVTSYEGQGNTSYSLIKPKAGVDLIVAAPTLAGGAGGDIALVSALVSNYGNTVATSILLTATLDSNLGYVGAFPAPSSVMTPTIVWTLNDMGFLGNGQIVLYTRVPEASIGNRYLVTWTVTSASTDADPSNNKAMTEVMVSRQVFLPLVMRNYR